jgi:hypothetical protein
MHDDPIAVVTTGSLMLSGIDGYGDEYAIGSLGAYGDER